MDAPVNIDELKIRLLILCKSKNKFESIANYLTRRGWETTISTTIKDAFKTIAVFKPDFVLVSVNVPTPKIAQLPMVIAQTFKTKTVLFSEAADVKAIKALQTIEAQYKISGSASGPSVHRRIKQILQEIHGPKAAVGSREAHDYKSDGPDARVFKGSAEKAESTAIHLDGGVIIQKSPATNGINFLRAGSIMQEGERANNSATQFHDGAPDDFMALAAEFQESESITPDESDTCEIENLNESPLNNTDEKELLSEGAPGRPNGGAPGTFPAHIQPPRGRSSSEKANTPAQTQAREQGGAQFQASDIFDKIVHIAKACVLSQQTQATKVEAFGECMIVPILNPGANTYIVLAGLGAIEEEIQFSTAFLSRLKVDLCSEYQGMQIGEDQRIEFEMIEAGIAIENEVGSLRLKNGSGEILIKLLNEVNYSPHVADIKGEMKAEIDPNDLVPNAAVGVEVFLYLKRNERYYLYLKPRSRISEKQKGRLLGGNSNLFVNKNEIETYRTVLRKNKTLEAFYDQSKRRKSAA